MSYAKTGDASSRKRDRSACPWVPQEDVPEVARQAHEDAVALAADVHDVDPREIWGRLARWNQRDPIRLYAACVALAAMVPIEESVSRLLAWTDHLEVA